MADSPLLARNAQADMAAGFGSLFAANAAAALTRRVGIHGVMDIHISRGLEVTQLIGSVAALDRGPSGLIAKGASGFLHGNEAVELNVIERGQAVGVCIDVVQPMMHPAAYIQVDCFFKARISALCQAFGKGLP